MISEELFYHSLWEREDFINERERIYKFEEGFILWGLCSPNPRTSILSFGCKAERKNTGQERKTRYITALLRSAIPNGCR